MKQLINREKNEVILDTFLLYNIWLMKDLSLYLLFVHSNVHARLMDLVTLEFHTQSTTWIDDNRNFDFSEFRFTVVYQYP